MDFDFNPPDSEPTSQTPTPHPPMPPGPMPRACAPVKSPRRGRGWTIFFAICFLVSFLTNGLLIFLLIAVVSVVGAGSAGLINEAVIEQGPASQKIAVVSIDGIIAGQQSAFFKKQIEAAARDKRVKAVIVRVSSPGGTLSGSDQIYKEIRDFRTETSKPVIAFMESVAASGGYYTSAACEKIVAEPTAITGSIGVISYYFVVEQLLEDKLGVLPVVIKGGDKKDWPSSFRAPTDEQLAYMQERLVTPAYERFIQIVAESRKDVLDEADVRRLADGSIYTADLALSEKLIDQVGYFDDAVAMAKSMAGITEARVIQYQKPFSVADLLSYKASTSGAAIKLDKTLLYELCTPEVLYLYSTY